MLWFMSAEVSCLTKGNFGWLVKNNLKKCHRATRTHLQTTKYRPKKNLFLKLVIT